jgi:hypothetical protein
MPYDIHLIKAKAWSDIPRNPVTGDDIDVLLAADPELSWSPRDTYLMRDDFGRTTRCFVIKWNEEPCFQFVGGEIVCRDAEEEHIVKLVELATHIEAKVIGDDGERYKPKRFLLWNTGIGIEPAA